jgi:phage FluMu protein gp41
VRDYRSGSEALDAAEAEVVLTELYASGLPDASMSAERRRRAYARCAEQASQVAELCAALARGLESWGGGGR